MDIMEICNNIEKRLIDEGLVGKRLGSGYCFLDQSRNVVFETIEGKGNDARAWEIVKEETSKDESFSCDHFYKADEKDPNLYCNFGFIIKPKNPVRIEDENLNKLIRLSKANNIIKSMLPFMPKENIEGIIEIVEQAEDFLREESKYRKESKDDEGIKNTQENRQNRLNEKKIAQFETLLNELQSKAILNFGYNADGTYNWKWCDCKPSCGDKYTDCIWRGLKYYNCDTCKDGQLYAKPIPEGTTFTGTSNCED